MDQARSGGSGVKTTRCLLCCLAPVVVNATEISSPQKSEDIRKLVKALCDYRKLTVAIPDYCPEFMFPFCTDCKLKLQRLSRQLEEVKETFAEIERKVADGEIARLGQVCSLDDASLDKNKCTVLRTMLLEGYRAKLLDEQRLKDNLLIEGQNAPGPSSSLSSHGLLDPLSTSSPPIHPTESADSRGTEYPWLNVDKRDEEEEEAVPIPTSRSRSLREAESDSEEDFSFAVVDVRTLSDSGEASVNEIVVKQERSDENYVDNDDDEAVLDLAITPRPLMFEGVEIFHIIDPKTKTTDRLQCGGCNYAVLSTVANEETRNTPLSRMKIHIRSAHCTSRPRLSSRKKGGKRRQTFNKMEKAAIDVSLSYHSQIHMCNICGRPVRGSMGHLKQHQFSHKNDAERQAAVDAGEKCVYTKARLANRIYFQLKGTPTTTRSPAPETVQEKGKGKRKRVFKCYSCGIIFSTGEELRSHKTKRHLARRRSVPRNSTVPKRRLNGAQV